MGLLVELCNTETLHIGGMPTSRPTGYGRISMHSGNHGLICRSCGNESDLGAIRDGSTVTGDGETVLRCPVCGSDSFGV